MISTKYMDEFLKTNVPMIEYSNLQVITINENQCIVMIPFTHKTKNHVNSMYFGALAIGAEVSAGLIPFYQLKSNNINSTVLFKNFTANFLKRPEEDVYFVCNEGETVSQAIEKAINTKERVNFDVGVVAVLDYNKLENPVATFTLTISIT